jgi:hypothetical protein
MSSECPTVLTFVLGNIKNIEAARSLISDYGRVVHPHLINYSVSKLQNNLHVQDKLIESMMDGGLLDSGIYLFPHF